MLTMRGQLWQLLLHLLLLIIMFCIWNFLQSVQDQLIIAIAVSSGGMLSGLMSPGQIGKGNEVWPRE